MKCVPMEIPDFLQCFPQNFSVLPLGRLIEAIGLRIVGDGCAALRAECFLNDVAAGIKKHIDINDTFLAEDGFLHFKIPKGNEIQGCVL